MRICFFSSEGLHAIKSQQYSIQDVEILSKLGHDVVISSNFLNLDFKADLYFSWWASGSIIPMFLAKIRNKPIIVIAGGNEVLHTRDSVSNKKIGYLSYPFYKRMAVKLCIHFSDRLLVVSNFMKTELEKVHNIAPDLLYNSIDSRVFSPQGNSRNYITSIVNLDRDVVKLKRLKNSLLAFKSVLTDFPNMKFIIIGRKGNYTSSIIDFIKKHNLSSNCELTGLLPNHEVSKWFNKSRLYIQPSDIETFGVSVAEAMACETPVLISKQGALPEVGSSFAFYADHNSASELSAVIKKILNYNEASLRERTRAGRLHIITQFSRNNRLKQIKEVISSLT